MVAASPCSMRNSTGGAEVGSNNNFSARWLHHAILCRLGVLIVFDRFGPQHVVLAMVGPFQKRSAKETGQSININ